MKFTARGGPDMVRKIDRAVRNMPREMDRAEFTVANQEMTEMKRRTPVWNPKRKLPHGHVPGSLRASGTVHEPEQHGKRIATKMTFGGGDVDYAVYVHEDLEAEHATGEAKYMESVLNESQPYIGRRLAAEIDFDRAVKE